ncbi:MAG TPA: capsular polysaccharide synthesis protein [Mucilaginibacter sp.]|nr:capsular polysaccharide synthesis protein [Mucilaginibacter sp.]
MNNTLPKIIWFLWLQGLDDSPLVVKKCYASWVKHNPGWQVNLLDANTIGQYLSVDLPGVTRQTLSDILRITLLQKYGGVWVDATCYCNKPLDNWLYPYLSTGFFAFERPAADRMISSWFLASVKGNCIVSAYKNAVDNYWNKHPRLAFFEKSRWYFLRKLLKNKPPQWWFGPIATKVLKIYPYFWFHYLFESVYLRDSEFRRQWDATPKISADIPHSIQYAGMFSPANDDMKMEIRNKNAPVYKLSWKYEAAKYLAGTLMYYLLESED